MSNSQESELPKRRDDDFFNRMTVEQRQAWAKGIVNRMMIAGGFDGKKDLADWLGCHQNTPSNWLQQGTVPFKAIYLCHKESGVSLDWLCDGIEPAIKIPGNIRYQLEKALAEILSLAEREKLVKGVLEDNFKTVSKLLVKEVTLCLCPPPQNNKPDPQLKLV